MCRDVLDHCSVHVMKLTVGHRTGGMRVMHKVSFRINTLSFFQLNVIMYLWRSGCLRPFKCNSAIYALHHGGENSKWLQRVTCTEATVNASVP